MVQRGSVLLLSASMLAIGLAVPVANAQTAGIELEEVPFEHEPTTEQRRNAPLPLHATVYDANVRQVRVRYRTAPSGEWRTIRLKQQDEQFSGLVGCQTLAGAKELQYYIEALGPDGVLDSSGSESAPHIVTLSSTGPRAHLPEEEPPPLCPADGPLAESEPEGSEPVEGPKKPPLVHWSANVAQDFQIAGGTDVCSKESQLNDGYACFRSQGSQYIGTPLPGQGGDVSGFQIATTRVLAGVDFVAGPVTLGVRGGGTVRGTGPSPAGGDVFRGHAEGRLEYWFAERPYGDGVSVYLLLGGGLMQVDSHAKATLVEDRSVPPPTSQLDNPDTQTVDVYKKSGDGFATVGAGLYVPFGSIHGLLAELRASQLLPATGTAFSIGVGYAVGGP